MSNNIIQFPKKNVDNGPTLDEFMSFVKGIKGLEEIFDINDQELKEYFDDNVISLDKKNE